MPDDVNAPDTDTGDEKKESSEACSGKWCCGCFWIIMIPVAIAINAGIWGGLCSDYDYDESARPDSVRADSALSAQESGNPSNPETEASSGPAEQPAPVSTWAVVRSVDEASGTETALARSRAQSPFPRLSPPFDELEATLNVDCGQAWIEFSQSPILSDRDATYGYDDIPVAVRVNGALQYWRGTRQWGSSRLVFLPAARDVWSANSSFQAAINFNEETARFNWSLMGSASAITEACD